MRFIYALFDKDYPEHLRYIGLSYGDIGRPFTHLESGQHRRYQRLEEHQKSSDAAFQRFADNYDYFIDLAAKARAAKVKS